jgi:hypothetical protein
MQKFTRRDFSKKLVAAGVGAVGAAVSRTTGVRAQSIGFDLDSIPDGRIMEFASWNMYANVQGYNRPYNTLDPRLMADPAFIFYAYMGTMEQLRAAGLDSYIEQFAWEPSPITDNRIDLWEAYRQVQENVGVSGWDGWLWSRVNDVYAPYHGQDPTPLFHQVWNMGGWDVFHSALAGLVYSYWETISNERGWPMPDIPGIVELKESEKYFANSPKLRSVAWKDRPKSRFRGAEPRVRKVGVQSYTDPYCFVDLPFLPWDCYRIYPPWPPLVDPTIWPDLSDPENPINPGCPCWGTDVPWYNPFSISVPLPMKGLSKGDLCLIGSFAGLYLSVIGLALRIGGAAAMVWPPLGVTLTVIGIALSAIRLIFC